MIRPQKIMVPDAAVSSLHQLQILVGSLQWLRQFALFSPQEMRELTDLLKGDTDLAAPRELSARHQRLLSHFFERLQQGALQRQDATRGIQAHLLLQPVWATIILHQREVGRALLFGYVTTPRVALPQWGVLLAQAIQWARDKVLAIAGTEPQAITVELDSMSRTQLQKNSLAVQTALADYPGVITSSPRTQYTDLLQLVTILPVLPLAESPLHGITAFTDAAGKTQRYAVAWFSQGVWRSKVRED